MGPRESIDLRRFTQDYILHSTGFLGSPEDCRIFRLRTAEERRDGAEARSKMNQIIDDVFFHRLKLGVLSRFEDVDGSRQNNTNLGRTQLHRSGSLKIWVSLERVISLFRTDISDSERYQEQWRIAAILIHDLTHAFRFAINNFNGQDFKGTPGGFVSNVSVMEPYFEGEQTAELGFSISQALLGGVPVEAGRNDDVGGPAFVMFSRWFPSTIDPTQKMPKLIPPPGETIVVPIPVTYFENIHSKDYWETCVGSFGIASALKPVFSTRGGAYASTKRVKGAPEWIVVTKFEAARLARFDENSQ